MKLTKYALSYTCIAHDECLDVEITEPKVMKKYNGKVIDINSIKSIKI